LTKQFENTKTPNNLDNTRLDYLLDQIEDLERKSSLANISLFVLTYLSFVTGYFIRNLF
jgi:hypothetical protein